MKTKNKILPEQEEEKTFQYRTYGKGELALLYLHNILQQSAVLHSRTSKTHRRSTPRTLIEVLSIRYQVW